MVERLPDTDHEAALAISTLFACDYCLLRGADRRDATSADHPIYSETATAEARVAMSAAVHAETAARTAQLTAEAALRKAERDALEAERLAAREEEAEESAVEAESRAWNRGAAGWRPSTARSASSTAVEVCQPACSEAPLPASPFPNASYTHGR